MAAKLYQFKVTLTDSDPPIWRRIIVPASLTLAELHRILQVVMGWGDLSPYHYRLTQRRSDTEPALLHMPLSEIVRDDLTEFTYVYDPRDGWFHTLTLEMVLPSDPDGSYPHCVAGDRACPPEGSGGIWGYEELLDLLDDPDHPEYVDQWDRVGGEFDPNAFDVEFVNVQLHPGTGEVGQ